MMDRYLRLCSIGFLAQYLPHLKGKHNPKQIHDLSAINKTPLTTTSGSARSAQPSGGSDGKASTCPEPWHNVSCTLAQDSEM